MISLGAGIYEELLFRVLLVGALVWLGTAVLRWRKGAAAAFATIVGALVFSAFHYVGPYGDPLELSSITFRALAGLVFSAMYLARGFGITAWTHALYDVMLTVG
jgi:membrane protease YdiL (CAAX protease family)